MNCKKLLEESVAASRELLEQSSLEKDKVRQELRNVFELRVLILLDLEKSIQELELAAAASAGVRQMTHFLGWYVQPR